MLCLKYSILQVTMSALFVMWLKLRPSVNSWYIEMVLSWRTYRNSTVSTWPSVYAQWQKWTAWIIIYHFVTLAFIFVRVVLVICTLSVCVSLLSGERIKIVKMPAICRLAYLCLSMCLYVSVFRTKWPLTRRPIRRISFTRQYLDNV